MEEKYWKQFESSGRVEDYLSFVSSARGSRRDMAPGEGEHSAEGVPFGEKGSRENALYGNTHAF